MREIENLIFQAEQKSEAEIVCVIAKTGLNSEILALYFSAIFAFLAGFICLFIDEISKIRLFEITLFCFLAFKILFSFVPNLVKFLVPRFLKFRLTRDFAKAKNENFGYKNFKNSVVVFLFLDEKILHILCGENVSKFISNAEFSEILKNFSLKIKNENFESCIENLVQEICEVCVKKFPKSGEKNAKIDESLVHLK